MAGWFNSTPAQSRIFTPGWFDAAPEPPDPLIDVGWWAVLALDLRDIADPVQAIEFGAIKGLALAQLAGSTQSLGLQKIAMAAFANTATADQLLALSKIALAQLASTAPATQALALVKVLQLAAAASVAPAAQALALARVGVLALAATAPAAQAIALRKIALAAFAGDGSASQTFALMKTAVLAMSTSTAPAVSGLGIGFPPNDPAVFTQSAAGPWSYNFPRWADRIDLVGVGGGSRGTNGGSFFNGAGGNAASWFGITLIRGVDIGWDVTTVSGEVGRGGNTSGGAGVDTTMTIDGTTYTALRGAGQFSAADPVGKSPGDFDHAGQTYVGGGTQSSLNNPGRPPGGGSAGGGAFSSSQSGAAGQVWVRAYQM